MYSEYVFSQGCQVSVILFGLGHITDALPSCVCFPRVCPTVDNRGRWIKQVEMTIRCFAAKKPRELKKHLVMDGANLGGHL